MANDDLAMLLFRVHFMIEERGERDRENGGSLFEGDAVFLPIGSGFVLIPLKLYAHVAPIALFGTVWIDSTTDPVVPLCAFKLYLVAPSTQAAASCRRTFFLPLVSEGMRG